MDDMMHMMHAAQKMEKAAMVFAAAMCAAIELMEMSTENSIRIANGESLAYTGEDFKKIITDNCIHHNGVMATLSRGM